MENLEVRHCLAASALFIASIGAVAARTEVFADQQPLPNQQVIDFALPAVYIP